MVLCSSQTDLLWMPRQSLKIFATIPSFSHSQTYYIQPYILLSNKMFERIKKNAQYYCTPLEITLQANIHKRQPLHIFNQPNGNSTSD